MILAAAAVALASCGGNAPRRSAQQETGAFKPDIHNAETSLDYRGTYRGVLPAADCPGIETTLTLKPDGTYSLHEESSATRVSTRREPTPCTATC